MATMPLAFAVGINNILLKQLDLCYKNHNKYLKSKKTPALTIKPKQVFKLFVTNLSQ